MSVKVDIPYGDLSVTVRIDEDRLAGVLVPGPCEPIADLTAAVHQSLGQPVEAPALAQAAVAGDRVVLVVDEPGRQAPTVEMVTGVVEALAEGPIDLDDITLLVARQRLGWVSPEALRALAGPFAGRVRIEVHDPQDRSRLAYLASTSGGRRVYLNRTLVDADVAVVCAQVELDPAFGFGGGLASLVPGLSDQDSWQRYGRQVRATAAGSAQALLNAHPLQSEMEEIAWLLGLQFSVLVLTAPSGRPIRVWAGEPRRVCRQSAAFCRQWAVPRLEEPVDLAIVGLDGYGGGQHLSDGLVALTYARHVVRQGGAIAMVSRCDQGLGLGRWTARLAAADRPAAVRQQIKDLYGPTELSLGHLLDAAEQVRLYLLSDLPAEDVDGLFLTALSDMGMLERLAAGVGRVAVIPHGRQTLVRMAGPTEPDSGG